MGFQIKVKDEKLKVQLSLVIQIKMKIVRLEAEPLSKAHATLGDKRGLLWKVEILWGSLYWT